jgi:hypothetical protein
MLARVARCRKPETVRNAETRTASDRKHSSPRQDPNIATDHNGIAPARGSPCHGSRIRELNRVFGRLTSGTRVWIREAGCKDFWLENFGAHKNLAVSVIAVVTRIYASTSGATIQQVLAELRELSADYRKTGHLLNT